MSDDAGAGAGEPGEPDDLDEAIAAKVSDYLDGALGDAERAEVEGKIAQDPAWNRAHAELTETRKVLSGMRKAAAPASFVDAVAETIHQRSAGVWFGRRTLGDRVPFGALVALALVGVAVIAYVLWASSTGSLKVDRDPAVPDGSAAVDKP